MANDNISEVLARNGLVRSHIADAEGAMSFDDYPGARRVLETVARLQYEAARLLSEAETLGYGDAGNSIYDARLILDDARAILAEVLR